MAKLKPVGAGAIVEVDLAQDGVLWNAVGCTTSLTPPPQVKTDIETTCQQDSAATSQQGIEQLSQAEYIEPYDYAFGQTWTDDLYASGAEADWKMTFQAQGVTPLVVEFSGYISGIVPGAAGGSDPLTRTVTITRSGAQTITGPTSV